MTKQALSLQSIMTYFRKRWSTAPDVRKPSNNAKYAIADGILAAFAVFFMQCFDKLSNRPVLSWSINE
jgi:hypothetical protein